MKNVVHILILQFAFLACCVLLLGYTGRDDSHITFFVSQNIADGNGLINYNGDAVEQSSSLTFSLILGFGVWLSGLAAASIGPFVSFFFLCLSLLTAALIVGQTTFSPLAILGIVTMPSVYWSLSGMENSLYLFLFLLLCLLIVLESKSRLRLNKPPERSSFLDTCDRSILNGHTYKPVVKLTYLILILATSAALSLTRPEYIFVILLAAILFILVGWQDLHHHATLAAYIVFGGVAGISARLMVGLELFPNTVLAKSGNPDLKNDAWFGIEYVFQTASQVPFSAIFAATGLLSGICYYRPLRPSTESTAIKFLLSISFSIGAFSIGSGGDWMEVGRFLSTPIALSTFAGLALLRRNSSPFLVAAFLTCMLYDSYLVANKYFGGIPFLMRHTYSVENYDVSPLESYNVIHSRDISFVDRVLPILKFYISVDERLIIASKQAGMVPYYLRRDLGDRFYFIDLLGLASNHVHHCRGADGWGYDPYDDLPALQTCIGIEFDFVFDLDDEKWRRLEYLESIGCREVIRDKVVIERIPRWKERRNFQQFLVDCR